MLILPLHKPLNLKTMPWMCVVILLINVLIYFGWQVPGDTAYQRAIMRYIGAGLIDIEAPVVLNAMSEAERDTLRSDLQLKDACDVPETDLSEDYDPFEGYEGFAATDKQALREQMFVSALPKPFACVNKFELAMKMLPTLQSSSALQKQISGQTIVAGGAPNFESYYRERGMFQREWEQGYFTHRYAQNFSAPKPYMLLTATFLHGSFDHLLGNMVFLMLVGLLVEGGFSRVGFLALYLLSGIGASAISLASHQGHYGIGLGASGAIAGLMGALPVLWGLRKVRVFYWLAFFFDYVRVPALLLLPIWLGSELVGLFGAESMTDFQAHIGGIVCGALIAFIAVRAGWTKLEFLQDTGAPAEISAGSAAPDTPAVVTPAMLRTQADLAMSKLKFREALRYFDQLMVAQPNDDAVKLIAFRAARFVPDLVRAKALASSVFLSSAAWPDQLEVWHQCASADIAFECEELERCFAQAAIANGAHAARMDLLWLMLEAIMRHPKRQAVQRDRFVGALRSFASVLADTVRKQKVLGLLQKLEGAK
jgi:membrane associated rhomboid family serine protease